MNSVRPTVDAILRRAALAAVLAFVLPEAGWAQASSLQQQIDNALKRTARPPGLTRTLGAGQPAANPKAALERQFIQRLRVRSMETDSTQQPPVSLEERNQIAEIIKDKPKIDLEINFDYNSAAVGAKAQTALTALGSVLAKDEHRGTVFFINGYTDAAGSAEYNLGLSQRRAEAVRQVLIERYRLAPDTLIATGFGKEQLKVSARPLADENRRVQIVNTEHKALAAR